MYSVEHKIDIYSTGNMLKRDTYLANVISIAPIPVENLLESGPAALPGADFQILAPTGCNSIWIIHHVITVKQIGMVKGPTGTDQLCQSGCCDLHTTG